MPFQLFNKTCVRQKNNPPTFEQVIQISKQHLDSRIVFADHNNWGKDPLFEIFKAANYEPHSDGSTPVVYCVGEDIFCKGRLCIGLEIYRWHADPKGKLTRYGIAKLDALCGLDRRYWRRQRRQLFSRHEFNLQDFKKAIALANLAADRLQCNDYCMWFQ